MIKPLSAFIANLNIACKILFSMLVIAMFLASFLGLFSSVLFARFYREDTYVQTADSVQVGSQALEDSWQHLLYNVLETASSPGFADMVGDAHGGDLGQYRQHKMTLQEYITSLTLSNALLDSVVVVGKNGEVYSLFTKTLKKEAAPSEYFGLDFSYMKGITWFPVGESPFRQNNLVIPVVLPISQLPKTSYLKVVDFPEEADVFLFLFLDSQRVNERLALGQSSYSDRIMYIADSQGTNLSLTEDSPYYELSASRSVTEALGRIPGDGSMELVEDTADYTIYSKPLNFGDMKMVCILPKDILYSRLMNMDLMIAVCAAAGLLLAALLALKLSRFVTRPFHQLISNVKNIENNTYDTPWEMAYHDEVGHLNQAINSMYATIQQQFVRIKETERSKFRAEIQLLSEQINPHFLYNTLECINMEILGGHREEASSMVTSLSDFLRTGLNYGNEMIPIQREIAHVRAYIDIMNHRFNQKIRFECSISPELERMSVLKLILQPLAENSIRHGFNQEECCADAILMPAISVRIKKCDDCVLMELSDNGCGIDVQKAEAALHPENTEGIQKSHVGLYNIHQRLSACYGSVSIEFESIPFFCNTVRIRIPGPEE